MVFGSTLTAPSFVEILKMKRFFSKSLLFLYKCIDITIFVFFKRKSKKASPYREKSFENLSGTIKLRIDKLKTQYRNSNCSKSHSVK